ncbi:MAG: hypothetical protein B5766_05495 [Candidatus Lumbricidophila eiseniae]|uniref:Uncharacterized protein n=1 Tax=Candidatus Lumbricidiphila eiseniae TaxID=1969409 RepID=A0A2A6FS59_9MICO|nr:MAG: hypothetical protein B5766_05495 [Candidatus Lumbricidophila eiseniae]
MVLIDQIKTPFVLHVTIPPTVTSPSFTARAMLDQEAKQYYASSVAMEHMGIRISSTRITQTPVQKTMAPVLRTLLAEKNAELVDAHPLSETVVQRQTTAHRRPETHRNAERRHAHRSSARLQLPEAPIKAVACAAGIDNKDAKRWLTLARKREVL